MADDFDDLFRSSHTNASHAAPSTPGWGTYGEDDLTTGNPFADLQSSRLYESHIEQHPASSEAAQSPSLHDSFAQKASLSRRSTASSQASTSGPSAGQHDDHVRKQRSNSTSNSSTSTESGAAPVTGPPSSGDAHENGDRVLVSPFVTPDSNSEEAADPMGTSQATVGDEEGARAATMNSHHATRVQDSYWSSASVYEPSHDHGFGEGFAAGSGGFTSNVASSAAPTLAVQHYDDPHANGGFEDEGTREDEREQDAGPSSSREAEDAASIRTVGLESDTASMRSHRTLIHPSPTPQAPRLEDDPSGRPTFIITVSDPTKVGSAIDPINQHTVYTVRTRTSSSQFRKQDFSVLRRYRDFLWLVERLNENNPGVIVPPPPEKAAMGRFSQSFVESRRASLQRCLSQILRHPLLYNDPDLRLFLESDTFVTDVKQRALTTPTSATGFLGQQAESKTSFFSTLTGNRFVEFDEYFDLKRSSLDAFETGSKGLTKALVECTKQRAQVASASSELMTAFNNLATCELSAPVRDAFVKMADLEKRKAEIGEMQTKDEEQILLATAENYARLIGSIRHAFAARVKAFQAYQKGEAAVKTARAAHEKAKKQQRSNPDLATHAVYEISEAERRAISLKRDFEDVSRLIKTEMTRFDKEKTADFKEAIEKYAERLAIRQREIVEAWKRFVEMLEKGSKASTAATEQGESSSPAKQADTA